MRLTKLLFVFLLVALVGKAENGPTDWYNEDGKTHIIKTADQLADLAKRLLGDGYPSKNFEGDTILLGNDIDLADWLNGKDKGWLPIGRYISDINDFSFRGVFDGQGHVISGLWTSQSVTDVGLFGQIKGASAKIMNLTVEIDNEKGVTGNTNVGGLAGSNNGGTISNCVVTGNVTGFQTAGGLVGRNEFNATITNCSATGVVKGTGADGVYTGGLVGYNTRSTIANCYATGAVESPSSGNSINTGGLVGTNALVGNIINCYATGVVEGPSSGTDIYTGGLVGTLQGTITNCYFQGTSDTGIGKNAGTGTATPIADIKTLPTEATTWDFAYTWAIDSRADIDPADRINAGAPYLQMRDISWYDKDKNTFTLSTAAQLAGLAQLVNTGHSFYKDNEPDTTFILGNDIDLTEWLAVNGNDNDAGWMPIGNNTIKFNASFNGQGHTISGLWINRSETDNVGFFGIINNKTKIENLIIMIDTEEGGVQGKDFTGGLVGVNYGSITKCAVLPINPVKTMVLGKNSTGGLTGYNSHTIEYCYTTGQVRGSGQVGGLAGANHGSVGTSIKNSYATGSVTGTNIRIGGLVGENNNPISNSYAIGKVAGSSQIGGLIGYKEEIATASFYENATEADDTGYGKGLPSENMKAKDTYTGVYYPDNKWEFGDTGADPIWSIDANKVKNQGYPYLSWQSSSTITLTLGSSFIYKVNNEKVQTGENEIMALIGDSVSFTLSAATGYKATETVEVKLGEKVLKADDKGVYTINPVLGNSVISVTAGSFVEATYTITLTPGDNFSYDVDGEFEKDGDDTYIVTHGDDFTFSLIPNTGYTADDAVVTAEGDNGGLKDFELGTGPYTLTNIACDSTITVDGIVLIPVEPTDPQSVITYHTLDLSVGEGIVIDKTKNSFQIQSGNPFSFVITLAEGYEGQTPTVTVNGKTKGLISIGTDKWRCILSEIYEDTNVAVGFNLTGNEQVAAPRLYSRGGQLFVETPIATTLTVYAIAGQTVVSRSLAEGLTSFPLAKGIYIVKLGERIEKITVNDK